MRKELAMGLIALINSYDASEEDNLYKIWVYILQEIRKKLLMSVMEHIPKIRLRDYQVLAFKEMIGHINMVEVLDQSPFLYAELESIKQQLKLN
jgi:hypothetical protein